MSPSLRLYIMQTRKIFRTYHKILDCRDLVRLLLISDTCISMMYELFQVLNQLNQNKCGQKWIFSSLSTNIYNIFHITFYSLVSFESVISNNFSFSAYMSSTLSNHIAFSFSCRLEYNVCSSSLQVVELALRIKSRKLYEK